MPARGPCRRHEEESTDDVVLDVRLIGGVERPFQRRVGDHGDGGLRFLGFERCDGLTELAEAGRRTAPTSEQISIDDDQTGLHHDDATAIEAPTMTPVTAPTGLPGSPPLPDPPAAVDAPVRPSRASRVTAVCAACALGAACTYTAIVDPASSGAYPQCPLRLITGVDCIMCGGLRATHSLLGGDVARAASQNLLVVLLAPFALYAMVQWFGAQFGWRLPALRIRPWMMWTVLAVSVVFMVVRNLSWGPGPWLHSDL